jgi:hypothetical protein
MVDGVPYARTASPSPPPNLVILRFEEALQQVPPVAERLIERAQKRQLALRGARVGGDWRVGDAEAGAEEIGGRRRGRKMMYMGDGGQGSTALRLRRGRDRGAARKENR